MNAEIAVIGGGLSGLAAAELLASAGKKIILLEQEEELGGLAGSFFMNGRWIPVTYHHIMKPDIMSLRYFKKFCRDTELRWTNTSQVVWYEGNRYLLSKPHHIFLFRPLSFKEKLQLALFGMYCLFPHNWEKLDRERCDQWLHKKLGEKTTDILFKNLVEMKFGLPLKEVSTGWLAKRLNQSVRSKDWYAYPATGIKTLVDRLEERIIQGNGVIKKHTKVVRIQNNVVETLDLNNNQRDSCAVKKIVSTVPPGVLLGLSDLQGDIKRRLEAISYKTLIGFVFGSPQKITEHYWNIILHPPLSFGGLFNHSVINPDGFNGEQIYYLFTYTTGDDPFYLQSEEKLKKIYTEDLEKIWPGITISWGRIFKIEYGAPVYKRNYSNPPVRTGCQNIYLAGIYKEYPNPRTMDSALQSGMKAAEYILNES